MQERHDYMNRAGTPYAFSTRRALRFRATCLRVRGKNLALPGLTALIAALPLMAGAQAGQNTPVPSGPQARPSGAAMQTPAPPLVTSTVTSTQITAESAPYHLEWNGTTGTLVRSAFGIQPEQRLPLQYLHTEPGPKGYAKYLTWFLARDADRFSIVWCYLNDSGHEFFCWLYQYPTNQLTTLRFVGDYRFVPSPEPVAPAPIGKINTSVTPLYNGPDFTYRNWTRRSGMLDSLQLTPARTDAFAAPPDAEEGNSASGGAGQAGSRAAATKDAPTATLSSLRVAPLHEIHVAKGNGWRPGGWRELHALAHDGANNPYYLIMYSNVTKGYVIDLKTAQTYVTDFGQRVVFKNDNRVFGAKEEVVVGPPDTRIRRYTRLEIPLVSTRKIDNPYTEVYMDVDFRSPDGRIISVPGFWDGGQTWRVRFAPTQVGNWSWSSRSDDPELHDQTGSFICVADGTGNKGFVTANVGLTDRHGFSYSSNAPFYPAFLREPVHYLPGIAVAAAGVPAKPPLLPKPQTSGETLLAIQDAPAQAAGGNAPHAAGNTAMLAPTDPPSYGNFKTRVDQAAALHFNRFWGGYLLDPTQFPQKTQANEGGAPFVNYDLNALNPAYFQWMDRRVAYCNEKGIVPDISLGDLNAGFMASVSDAQLSRLWRYVVARYAAFDVNWNLFGLSAPQTYPASADTLIENLARLTRRSDPIGHPLSTVVPNVPPAAAPPAPKPSGGPILITPDPLPPGAVLPPAPGAGAAGGDGQPGRGNRRFGGNGNNGNNNTPPGFSPGTGNPQNRGRNGRRGGQQPGGMNGDTNADVTNGTNSNASHISGEFEQHGTEQQLRGDRGPERSRRPARQPEIPAAFGRSGHAARCTLWTLAPAGRDHPSGRRTQRIGLRLPPGQAHCPRGHERCRRPDAARYRLWETAMRGGFWAAGTGRGESSAQPLDSAVTRWQAACANLFRSTQYNRLLPHQDMLGGPDESLTERRRRRQAEAAAGQTASTPTAPNPALPAPPPPDLQNEDDLEAYLSALEARSASPVAGPIYVLADPGWEYVVYFQHGGTVTLDLLEATGNIRQSWYNPRTGEFVSQRATLGGAYKTFSCPDNNDWVLYLSRR